jgi:uncharacterized protein (TIGR03083 family)
MTDPTSDRERLTGYVDTWWQAVDDFTALLEEIPEDAWTAPTDLPGWDVHAVAAHIAHLEAILAGAPEETVDVGEPEHVTGLMGMYTEQGVVARRDHTPDQLILEIRECATRRHTALLADPPADPAAKPDGVFGALGWSWETLLRNRPLDVWMHEQDIRRAVALPGRMDSAAAKHTADYLLESLGVVVGKRVAPPAGTTVVVAVDGSETVALEVADNGRANPTAEVPEAPTVGLHMGREDFIVLAGGRRDPADVQVTGDAELARRILDAIAVTP